MRRVSSPQVTKRSLLRLPIIAGAIALGAVGGLIGAALAVDAGVVHSTVTTPRDATSDVVAPSDGASPGDVSPPPTDPGVSDATTAAAPDAVVVAPPADPVTEAAPAPSTADPVTPTLAAPPPIVVQAVPPQPTIESVSPPRPYDPRLPITDTPDPPPPPWVTPPSN